MLARVQAGVEPERSCSTTESWQLLLSFSSNGEILLLSLCSQGGRNSCAGAGSCRSSSLCTPRENVVGEEEMGVSVPVGSYNGVVERNGIGHFQP
eukprot:3404621-Rhodomonas_salina.4